MKIAVVGVSGYVGAELVRWILQDPRLTLGEVVSRTGVGKRLADVLPGLEGFTEQEITAFDPASLATHDLVALCTPHGVSRTLVPALEMAGVPRILDLSADHRHAAGWVYGLPEWNQEALRAAARVAAPGCFASAIALALAPLVAADAVVGPVHVAAITGSTGSGAHPGPATHHPERDGNVRAYKVLRHQHVPEIQGFLEGLGGAPVLHFVPQSGPFARGIFATCFVPVASELNPSTVFADAYAATPFVRLRETTPELRHVRGTPFCDLSVYAEEGTAVILSAIDNLGRGAAAQGMQCITHMLGLEAAAPIPPLLP